MDMGGGESVTFLILRWKVERGGEREGRREKQKGREYEKWTREGKRKYGRLKYNKK